MDETQQRAAAYGVKGDFALTSDEVREMRESVDHSVHVDWADKRLAKIIRFRLIGYHPYEYPAWDLSYCYGELKDGTRCLVSLGGRSRFPAKWKSYVVNIARQDGVYAKGLGIFEAADNLQG